MNAFKALGTLVFSTTLIVGAAARPMFSVGDGTATDWTAAMASGNVSPLTSSLSNPTTEFYTDLVMTLGLNGFEQEFPTLTPDFPTSDGTSTQSALVMSWNQPSAQNTLGVATWQYLYNGDPDLTDLTLLFSALSPQGVQDLGVELVDTSGRAEGWYTTDPQIGTWDFSYMVDLSLQAPQGQFSTFIADPGFDITHVAGLRFDEASNSSDSFPVPDPTGNGAAWNAWGRVEVVPAPAACLPFLFGLLRRRGTPSPKVPTKNSIKIC